MTPQGSARVQTPGGQGKVNLFELDLFSVLSGQSESKLTGQRPRAGQTSPPESNQTWPLRSAGRAARAWECPNTSGQFGPPEYAVSGPVSFHSRCSLMDPWPLLWGLLDTSLDCWGAGTSFRGPRGLKKAQRGSERLAGPSPLVFGSIRRDPR